MVAAQRRYDRAEGDIYAAAIGYFTIFAMFPLLMVGFATAGFVLAGRPYWPRSTAASRRRCPETSRGI